MKIFGDRMKFRAALAGMLIGAVMQSACIGDSIDGEAGEPFTGAPAPSGTKPDLNTTGAPAPSGTKPDLNIPAAVPRGGASAGKASPAKGTGGAPAADSETQPPTPDACTEAGAPCAGAATCVVVPDGQPACKLRERAVCATNVECASGVCKDGACISPAANDASVVSFHITGKRCACTRLSTSASS